MTSDQFEGCFRWGPETTIPLAFCSGMVRSIGVITRRQVANHVYQSQTDWNVLF